MRPDLKSKEFQCFQMYGHQQKTKGIINRKQEAKQSISKQKYKQQSIAQETSNEINKNNQLYFPQQQSNHLTTVRLRFSQIHDQQCYHLSQQIWPNLQNIELSQNKIGAKGCSYLSKAHWKNLKMIFLDDNHINADGCSQLRKASWQNLEVIYIRRNNIGDAGCQHLSKAHWPHMKTLIISGNNIGPEGCSYLRKAQWPELEDIGLKFNKIGAKGCSHLSKARWPNIQKIELQDNRIGGKGCSYLNKAYWPHLKEVDLMANYIGSTGFGELFKSQWFVLKEMHLSKNGISQTFLELIKRVYPKTIIHFWPLDFVVTKLIERYDYVSSQRFIILNYYMQPQSQSKIKLGWKGIGKDQCQKLSQQHNPDLEEIQLYWNNIGSKGCQHLSKAYWPKLKKIDLQRSNVDAKGCSYLSKSQWPNLQEINLGSNSIGAEGCLHVSKAHWPNLAIISLAQGNISTEGCSYLSKVQWPNLQELNLDLNNIGSQGCSYLSKISWINLKKVELRSNNIGAEGCQYLSNSQWPNLQEMNLESNKIGNAGYPHLCKSQWPNLTTLYLCKNVVIWMGIQQTQLEQKCQGNLIQRVSNYRRHDYYTCEIFIFVKLLDPVNLCWHPDHNFSYQYLNSLQVMLIYANKFNDFLLICAGVIFQRILPCLHPNQMLCYRVPIFNNYSLLNQPVNNSLIFTKVFIQQASIIYLQDLRVQYNMDNQPNKQQLYTQQEVLDLIGQHFNTLDAGLFANVSSQFIDAQAKVLKVVEFRKQLESQQKHEQIKKQYSQSLMQLYSKFNDYEEKLGNLYKELQQKQNKIILLKKQLSDHCTNAKLEEQGNQEIKLLRELRNNVIRMTNSYLNFIESQDNPNQFHNSEGSGMDLTSMTIVQSLLRNKAAFLSLNQSMANDYKHQQYKYEQSLKQTINTYEQLNKLIPEASGSPKLTSNQQQILRQSQQRLSSIQQKMIQNLQQQLKQLKQKLADSEQNIQQYTTLVSTKESQISVKQTTINNFHQQIEELRKNNELIKNQIEAHKNKNIESIKSFQKQLQMLRKREQELKDQNAKIKALHNKQLMARQEQFEVILENKLNEINLLTNNYEDRIKDLSAAISQLKQENHTKELQIEKWQQRYEGQLKINERLKQQSQQFQETVAALQNKMIKSQEQKTLAQSQIQAQIASQEELCEKYEALQKQLKKTQMEYQTLTILVQEMKRKQKTAVEVLEEQKRQYQILWQICSQIQENQDNFKGELIKCIDDSWNDKMEGMIEWIIRNSNQGKEGAVVSKQGIDTYE